MYYHTMVMVLFLAGQRVRMIIKSYEGGNIVILFLSRHQTLGILVKRSKNTTRVTISESVVLLDLLLPTENRFTHDVLIDNIVGVSSRQSCRNRGT